MLEDLALDSAPQEASQEDQAALAHLEDLEDEADLLVAHPAFLRADHLVASEAHHPLAARHHQVSHPVDVAAPLDLADRLRGTFKTIVLGTANSL